MNTLDVPEGIAASDEITHEELQLAARNHGMPLEGLRYDVTPIGMHYLLTHFDIPEADAATWDIEVEGAVRNPISISLQALMGRPSVTHRVTMECAGNGRARLQPRPLSQPWLVEAVGTAEWTGTPLAPILEEAGLNDDAVEVVFTGADRGTQGGVEQEYQRSLSIDQAMDPGVILAYEINGVPLPPQHGAPVRLVVPGWYGMTSVKWLRRITGATVPFYGYQMDAYRLRSSPEDPGTPVTRMKPRALMIPPGFPDFFTRVRTVEAGEVRLEGRAWSGGGPIKSVEVSSDSGRTWTRAAVEPAPSEYAWAAWSFSWQAKRGDHELMVRATDAGGDVQPVDEPWNHHGLANNMTQRVAVTVV